MMNKIIVVENKIIPFDNSDVVIDNNTIRFVNSGNFYIEYIDSKGNENKVYYQVSRG